MLPTCNPCTLGPEAEVSAGRHHPQLYSEFMASLGEPMTKGKKKKEIVNAVTPSMAVLLGFSGGKKKKDGENESDYKNRLVGVVWGVQ